MGVKTEITLQEINEHFVCQSILPSNDGVSDTVYFLDESYILKIFEEKGIMSLDEESKLLNLCCDLPVSKVVKECFLIHNKPALIYQKCKGKSVKSATKNEIESIGRFLKSFHQKTSQKESKNSELFTKKRLFDLIKITSYQPFFEAFETIDITLKNDGIIHGDLFLDNANFDNGKLSCVFDFSEACNGDFLFDLGVVALSWCENTNDVTLLLESYETNLTLEEFIPYIQYAGLYYSVTRYLGKRDFQALQKRLECILN